MGFVKQVGQGLGLINNDPTAPVDFNAAADKQAAASKEAAQYNTQLNRANQVGPGGSLNWTQGPKGADGSPGQWTQTTSLSSENQKLYDQQQRLSGGLGGAAETALGRVNSTLSQPFDMTSYGNSQRAPTAGVLSNGPTAGALAAGPDAANYKTGQLDLNALTAMAGGPGSAISAGSARSGRSVQRTFDTSGVTAKIPNSADDTSRRRVEEALMSRIKPQYQQDESALRTRLLNSGIEVGTDAYNKEMNNFSQRLNDARMQSVVQGGAEETRQTQLQQGLNAQQFGQAQALGQFGQNADIAMAGNETQASIASANNSTQASIAGANLAQRGKESVVNSLLQGQGLNMQGNNQNFNQAGTAAAFANANQGTQFNQGLQSTAIANGNQGIQFAQGLQGAGFNNTVRQGDINNGLAQRQLPLAELNALRSGAQPQMPNFGGYYTGGQAEGGQYLKAATGQQGANQQYDAAMNTQQGQFGNLLRSGANFFMPTFGP